MESHNRSFLSVASLRPALLLIVGLGVAALWRSADADEDDPHAAVTTRIHSPALTSSGSPRPVASPTETVCRHCAVPESSSYPDETGALPSAAFIAGRPVTPVGLNAGVHAFFSNLLDTSDFPPRWRCGNWSEGLGWLHILSDLAIFGAYFSIPAALLFYVFRRTDLPFPRVLWLFAAFIFACGLTHLVEAGIFWWPVYRLSGLVKLLTAIVSWATVFALIRIAPRALSLPSTARLARQLQESQERLGIALAAGHIGVWEWDPDSDVLTGDERTHAIHGIGVDRPARSFQDFLATLDRDDVPRLKQLVAEALETGQPLETEYRVIWPDGSVHHVALRGRQRHTADGRRLVGVCIDETECRRADEECARLAAIVESSSDAIIGKTLTGIITSWNRAAERTYGYADAEVLGRPVSLLYPPDRRQELGEILQHVKRGEAVDQLQTVRVRKDGSPVEVSLTVSPIRDRDGRVIGASTIARDITGRKDAERTLRLMRAAYDSANEIMLIIGPDGGLVDVNDTACHALGYARDELLSLSIWDVKPEASQEDWSALVRQLRAQGGVVTQTEFQTKDGRRFPAEVSKSLVRFEDSEYIVDSVRDITRREAAEEALAESEARFRQLAGHLQDVLWMTSADGKEVIYVSPAYETIWGCTCESLYREPASWLGGVHPGDRKRVAASFFEGAAHEGFSETFRVIRPDQTIRWVRASGFPIRNAAGEVYRLAGVTRDISEQKKHERQLERAKEAAESSNRTKSQFLANMSHEIRTPLNSILGFTEVLRRGLGTAQEQAEHLETIHDSGRHLLTLIDDILDLSRIEAGRMDFEREVCSPHQILSDVLSVLRVRAEEKCLRLEAEWSGGVPETIRTDPARLRQLLMNVVGNAVKFTEQGSVSIVAGIDPHAPEPRFVIEVRDTGIGIPPERLETIFLPFEQADSSITRRFGGTGLGMPISREIARGLGGDITVESEPGQGSLFRITLETGPLDGVRILESPPTEAFLPNQRPAGAAVTRLPDARILLVEDGETNRDLVEFLLRDAGATVVSAENGKDGLEEAERAPFDLILMDVQMPVMDGYTAVREMRRRGLDLPIIALTAGAMRGDRETGLEAGFSGYLTKPIEVDSLLDTVAGALAESDVDDSGAHTSSPPEDGDAEPICSTLPLDRPEFREIVRSFGGKLCEKLEEMEAALRDEDLERLAALAHWLKGTGGTVGFHCFTEPAERLEEMARRQQPAGLAKDLHELKALASRVRTP